MVISKLHNHHLKWLLIQKVKHIHITGFEVGPQCCVYIACCWENPLGWNWNPRDGEITLDCLPSRGYWEDFFLHQHVAQPFSEMEISFLYLAISWSICDVNDWRVASLTPVIRTSDPNKSTNVVFFGFGSSTSESFESHFTHAYVVPVLLPCQKEWVQGYLPA